ncbi:MAG: MBL fold metallo-hydrolase [Rhodanobacteraceae bacterium]|nr:MAG: MBL fold metallo-hydrolase [Rhodanobacteraceae bacterium]
MQTTITEIAPDWFRLSTFSPAGIQFNEFLLRDTQPFLMHTGLRKMFPATLEAVASLIDPKDLRWIGFSHFEPDECGALNQWLQVAPRAQAVCSTIGARMLGDFADRPARALNDDEVLNTGTHRMRFLSTPYVPHCWDAGLFFDATQQTLMCSDLFFHPGNPQPVTEGDVVAPAKAALLASIASPTGSGMPYTPQTDGTLRRLAALKPHTLAIMHGSSFRGDGARAILDLARVAGEALGAGRTGATPAPH